MFNRKFRYGKISEIVKKPQSYLEFSDKQEADSWGQKYYKDWGTQYIRVMDKACKVKGINCFMTNVLQCYCGNESLAINEYLRGKVPKQNSYLEEKIDILTMIICTAPSIPNNLILYRLVSDEFIRTMINNNKKGQLTREDGFLSTSLLKDITRVDEEYACNKNLLKLYVPQGTIGAYVNSIREGYEYEMLLLPGRYLNMVRYPYKDKELEKMIFECKIVN